MNERQTRFVADALFTFALFLLAILVPLGTWKLSEIIIWLCTHVSVGVA